VGVGHERQEHRRLRRLERAARNGSNQGVCNSTSSNGDKTALFFTCIATNEKNTESDCWGRVVYLSGKNKGKTSTTSWHGKQNADGKGGTAIGAGYMN
jgi:hypothetical protein